jgi:peptidoglycan/xylan/chitin deacetylase (PgdA/CDA1 family)
LAAPKLSSKGGLSAGGYQTVPVLTYHRFSKDKSSGMIVSEARFEAQMNFLKNNGYNVITVNQFLDFLDFKARIPEKSVVLTFDDGWRSFYDIAYPIVKKHRFPATLFIYPDFIGAKSALSWKQLKELAENNTAIHCQSLTHRDLTTLKKKESFEEYFKSLNREILESKQVIEKRLKTQCTCFAYPYGASNKLVIALVKKHGYRGAFTVRRGGNPFFIDNFMINRTIVDGNDDLEKFKKSLGTFKKMSLK